MNNSIPLDNRDLGILQDKKNIFIYLNLYGYSKETLRLAQSRNGIKFKLYPNNPSIITAKGKKEESSRLNDFRISKNKEEYFLTYIKNHNGKKDVFIAVSKDLVLWNKASKLPLTETAMMAPQFKHKNMYVFYLGEETIKVSFSKDLKNFQNTREVLKPKVRSFDSFPLKILSVFNEKQGILVFYSVNVPDRSGGRYLIGAALFDKKYPEKLIWRNEEPVWEPKKELKDKKIYPLGAAILKNDLFLYFSSEQKFVYTVHFKNFIKELLNKASVKHPLLKKHFKNPIIKPVMEHFWESQATFNSAALNDNGKVHFLYRAMGDNNISVLGYASSKDGLNIDERLDQPAYLPSEPFEYSNGMEAVANYMSGGGYGGCEDPRLTRIDDTIYMTYVAFNGFDPPRVALTSIKRKDFLNKNWKWKKPKIISKPGVVDKNAVLFPEKINGKYTFLHRIFPNILIDFVEDLDFKKGSYLKGEYKIEPTTDGWDSRKVGAGPPPIKTKEGWLLIYHAVDDKDDSKYKIGAMLLDLNDPTKVLYRTKRPILEPTDKYENEGYKAGVAYPCGAALIKDILYVYYGGADKFLCVASKDLDELLTGLKKSGYLELEKNFKTVPVYKHND